MTQPCISTEMKQLPSEKKRRFFPISNVHWKPWLILSLQLNHWRGLSWRKLVYLVALFPTLPTIAVLLSGQTLRLMYIVQHGSFMDGNLDYQWRWHVTFQPKKTLATSKSTILHCAAFSSPSKGSTEPVLTTPSLYVTWSIKDPKLFPPQLCTSHGQ